MKFRFLLVLLCWLPGIKASAQAQVGLDVNFFSSSLINISPETIVPYGFSGAKTVPNNSYGVSPTILVRQKLSDKLGFEYGIGYLRIKQFTHLNFHYNYFQQQIDYSLIFTLHYLQVPVSLNYGLALSEKSSFLFSGGLKPKVLIKKRDNYETLLSHEPGWTKGFKRYNRVVISPNLGVSYQRKLSGKKSLEIGGTASLDATPFVWKDSWGYYENLYPARLLQIGTGFKYFFL